MKSKNAPKGTRRKKYCIVQLRNTPVYTNTKCGAALRKLRKIKIAYKKPPAWVRELLQKPAPYRSLFTGVYNKALRRAAKNNANLAEIGIFCMLPREQEKYMRQLPKKYLYCILLGITPPHKFMRKLLSALTQKSVREKGLQVIKFKFPWVSSYENKRNLLTKRQIRE